MIGHENKFLVFLRLAVLIGFYCNGLFFSNSPFSSSFLFEMGHTMIGKQYRPRSDAAECHISEAKLKNIVFRVTGLKILDRAGTQKSQIFFKKNSGKKQTFFYAFWKAFCLSKCIKLYLFFSRKLEKNSRFHQ